MPPPIRFMSGYIVESGIAIDWKGLVCILGVKDVLAGIGDISTNPPKELELVLTGIFPDIY